MTFHNIPHAIKERIEQDIINFEHGVESVSIQPTEIEVVVAPRAPLPKAREVVVGDERLPIHYVRGEVYSLSSHQLSSFMSPVIQPTADNPLCRTCSFETIRGGISLGHKDITAGTFGSIVFLDESSRWAILSNNHVLANANNAIKGDNILQPGRADSSTPRVIAKLERFVPMKYLNSYDEPITPDKQNQVDAALARPLDGVLKTRNIIDMGFPLGVHDPRVGMSVKKSGRTTGTNASTIKSVDVGMKVNYGTNANPKYAYFNNVIEIGPIIMPGDSGSLLLDAAGYAVGLVFAGAFKIENDVLVPIAGFACKIRPVLDSLQCTVLRRAVSSSINPVQEMIPRIVAGALTGGGGGIFV